MSWDGTCFVCGVRFCLFYSYLSIAVDSVMGRDWGKDNAVYIIIGVCLSAYHFLIIKNIRYWV